VWWPTWKGQHPDSAYSVGKRIEKWTLPAFGNLSFAALDADRIGAWKANLVASGLKPTSVNTYLSLLGTILNTAVDSDLWVPKTSSMTLTCGFASVVEVGEDPPSWRYTCSTSSSVSSPDGSRCWPAGRRP